MELYGLSDRGKVREINEDSLVFGKFPDGAGYAVICDGMGGANHGEVASAEAVERIEQNFLKSYKEDYSAQSIRNMINASFNIANYAVYDKANSDKAFAGMGTTVCAAVIKNGVVSVGNIGDSRAYIVGNTLRQITEDHSYVWDLVKKGEITKEEAEEHPKKNIITRALGAEETVAADYFVEELSEGETLLICSDGLSGFVSEEDIKAICKKELKTAAEELIKKANDNGGRDNISLILCRI